MNKALERYIRAKFRKSKKGKEQIERMMKEYPYLIVYWNGGREYCDLRRAAAITNTQMEVVHENLSWGDGEWKTAKFEVQSANVEEWLKETAKQRKEKAQFGVR